MPGPVLAAEQGLPLKFLEAILADLRRAGLVRTRRGPVGGYAKARSADQITVGEVVRAVDGPLAVVRRKRPGAGRVRGSGRAPCRSCGRAAAGCGSCWTRSPSPSCCPAMLPERVRDLVAEPGAWK